MNNFFNPFNDFDNIEQPNIKKQESDNKIELKKNDENKKIKKFKPYNNNVAHKYLSNTVSNKPNIFNLIKTYNLSDENNIKIIKYLYKNIKDEKKKQETIKFLSDEI